MEGGGIRRRVAGKEGDLEEGSREGGGSRVAGKEGGLGGG